MHARESMLHCLSKDGAYAYTPLNYSYYQVKVPENGDLFVIWAGKKDEYVLFARTLVKIYQADRPLLLSLSQSRIL